MIDQLSHTETSLGLNFIESFSKTNIFKVINESYWISTKSRFYVHLSLLRKRSQRFCNDNKAAKRKTNAVKTRN